MKSLAHSQLPPPNRSGSYVAVEELEEVLHALFREREHQPEHVW